MTTVTQWFDMEQRPINIGVYQVLDKMERVRFSRFNGLRWNMVHHDFDSASTETCKSVDCYDGFVISWRGLAEKPA